MPQFTLFKTGSKRNRNIFADIYIDSISIMPDMDRADLKRLAKTHKFKAVRLAKYSWGSDWTYELIKREVANSDYEKSLANFENDILNEAANRHL